MYSLQRTSNKINNLSLRCYSRHVALSTEDVDLRSTKASLSELNGRLEELYDDVYGIYTQLNATNAVGILKRIKVLVETLQMLVQQCESIKAELPDECEGLEDNLSAFHEIANDIKSYKIDLPNNQSIKNTLLNIASLA